MLVSAHMTPNVRSRGHRSLTLTAAPHWRGRRPKDGDVVVTLAESLASGTDFFSVTGGEKKAGVMEKLLFGKALGGTGADTQFEFTASISDPAAYRAEVVGMVKQAQRDMLVLVKQ